MSVIRKVKKAIQLFYIEIPKSIKYVTSITINFYRTGEQMQIIEQKPKQRLPFFRVLQMLWADGVRAYSNSYVVKWSLWVVVSTCVNYQVHFAS